MMTLQDIAKTVRTQDLLKVKYDRNIKSKIKNAKNTQLSSLVEFLSLIGYKVSLNGIKCNSVDDIRQIIVNTGYSAYELLKSGIHQTQFNSFIKGESNIQTQTLLNWCEVLEIVPTLEKS